MRTWLASYRRWWGPLLVLTGALLVRGAYLLELSGSLPFAALVGDGREYWAWAEEIRTVGWWGEEVFYQAPLYPYFLAAVSALFGAETGVVRLVQGVLGAASCLFLSLAARRFFSPGAGLLAGSLLAIYPPAIFFDGLIQKTSLGLFLTTLLLWLLAVLAERPAPGRWLAAGVVLAALGLTRENALLWVPLLVVWMALPVWSHRLSARVAWLVAFALGLALVLVPVGLRNRAIGGRFLLTTAQLGPNFYIGNNPVADGRYQPLVPRRQDARVERDDAATLAEAAVGRPLSAAGVSRYWLEQSLAWIRSSPESWLALLGRKGLMALNAHEIPDSESLEAYRDHSRLLRGLGWWHFGVLLPLAVVGVWATRRDWRRLLILYGVGLAVVAGVVLFYVLARYRFPLVPVLLMFAAAGLLGLLGEVKRRSWPSLAGNGVLLLATAVVANVPLPVRTSPRATTYYNLGVALFEQGDDRRAEAALLRAASLLPEAADVHYQLGRVRLARGLRESARSSLATAVDLEPAHAEARLGLVQLLIASGELELAEDHLRQALARPDPPAAAHGLLGNLLAHRGQLAEAEREYRAALARDPDFADARFKLGSLLLERGDAVAARPHLEAAVRLLEDFAEVHLRLAVALERLGEVEAAVRHYRRVLELRPSDAAAARALLALEASTRG